MLKINKCTAGEKVCEFGQLGYDFFILIQGKVCVKVPAQEIDPKDVEEGDDLIKLEEFGKTVYKKLINVSELSPGASFGELALINSKPRAATIECMDSPTELMTLNKEDYNNILGAKQKAEFKQNLAILRQFSLFKVFTDRKLEKVWQYCEPKEYVKNMVVYSSGDKVEGFYLLIEGTFQEFTQSKWIIYLKGKYNQKVSIISNLEENQIVGFDEVTLQKPTRINSMKCSSLSAKAIFVSSIVFGSCYSKKKSIIQTRNQLRQSYTNGIPKRLRGRIDLLSSEEILMTAKKHLLQKKLYLQKSRVKNYSTNLLKIQDKDTEARKAKIYKTLDKSILSKPLAFGDLGKPKMSLEKRKKIIKKNTMKRLTKSTSMNQGLCTQNQVILNQTKVKTSDIKQQEKSVLCSQRNSSQIIDRKKSNNLINENKNKITKRQASARPRREYRKKLQRNKTNASKLKLRPRSSIVSTSTTNNWEPPSPIFITSLVPVKQNCIPQFSKYVTVSSVSSPKKFSSSKTPGGGTTIASKGDIDVIDAFHCLPFGSTSILERSKI
ncbi:unnamed protein product [Moneuplotes crassus]|uniref:Cyclic nucleotide-binding domain-containing protein n=1 Tax=Euplotes crassus TaxID=5936 RepID=A0AAD2DAI1_EUPCR|nr:unnamed protein product [Moneuplotes crassus]